MAFESGVKRFIKGVAVIEVNFPVDWNDKEYITCTQCPYLSSNERMCQINKRPVQFPTRNVGYECPLNLCTKDGEFIEKEEKN